MRSEFNNSVDKQKKHWIHDRRIVWAMIDLEYIKVEPK